MKIIEKLIPDTDQQDIFLFHRQVFVFQLRETFILESSGGKIRIAFKWEGENLHSLPGCSFGSFSLQDGIQCTDLSLFIDEMIGHSAVRDSTVLQIRSYPECYDPAGWKMIRTALSKAGFIEAVNDVNQHLPITQKPFSQMIQPAERRYLHRAQRENWQFKKMDALTYLDESFRIFSASRRRKGYPMTMTREHIKAKMTSFPDNYLLFGAFKGNQLLAATLTIVINEGILYDFYHGDVDPSGSPTVFLLQGLYNFARENGFQILDLGISSDDGRQNDGLYSFKNHMGAVESGKITYVKHLK